LRLRPECDEIHENLELPKLWRLIGGCSIFGSTTLSKGSKCGRLAIRQGRLQCMCIPNAGHSYDGSS
jgi:hypothetical protein